MDNIDVVLYHGPGCPDGHTAAWAAWLKYPHAEFIPAKHGETFPEGLENKNVVIVDFCYPRAEMIELNRITNQLLCLDHHVTAMNDCKGLYFCHFDMNKSGAGLSWEYFHDDSPPLIIEYIQYRDLGFLWTRPESQHPPHLEQVLAGLDSYEKTFEQWNELSKLSFEQLVDAGTAIVRYQKQLIKTISKGAQPVTIRGKKALCVNTPFFQSEIGNYLARQEDAELGICWYQSREGTRFSLRSTDDKADVSKVASTFHKGGGHRNAAGFGSLDVDLDKILGNSKDK